MFGRKLWVICGICVLLLLACIYVKHISGRESHIACDGECERFRIRMANKPPDQFRAAIYYLVQVNRTQMIMNSLRTIDYYFNNKFRYPVIIFYEDDLLLDQRDQIRRSTRSDVYFQNVQFNTPSFILPEPWSRLNTSCHYRIGYKHMCRFQSKTLYDQPIMRFLDYSWRLDDDSLILSAINYDIFKYMSDNDIIYGYVFITQDRERCISGLWDATRRYIANNSIQTHFFDTWTEGDIYYNNFELSAMILWYSKEYQNYIDMVDKTGGMYYHRWGDAPIKSIAVSMFVPEDKTHCFLDFGYKHRRMQRTPTGV